MAWITELEGTLRLSLFFGLLIAMVTWEAAAPARRIEVPRLTRWSSNIGLVLIDTLLLRLALPLLAIGVAQKSWGVMNALPFGNLGLLYGLLGYIALELLIYWQHRMFHEVPFFWRFHRVHHSDGGLDASTALRFHPVEALISMVSKMALIAALGIPPLAVLVFELVLSGTAIFNHANIYLPPRLERWLRPLLVTPNHHRIHHSSVEQETNSNYAFSFTLWDHIFGTYRQDAAAGQAGMTIGLDDPIEQRLDKLILEPLQNR